MRWRRRLLRRQRRSAAQLEAFVRALDHVRAEYVAALPAIEDLRLSIEDFLPKARELPRLIEARLGNIRIEPPEET